MALKDALWHSKELLPAHRDAGFHTKGGNPVHTGVNVVLSLPSMEFPFPFLNLNENGILPLFSRDCGANLSFIFKSF